MSDDLTRAIAEALGCEKWSEDYFGDHCEPFCREHQHPWLRHEDACPKPARVAAALAPLVEARVREARADALTEVAESLRESAATVEQAKGATQRTWFMREMADVLQNRAREA